METVQASVIKCMFESLKDVLQDCNMCFNEKGATICAMDGAHVALVNMFIDAKKIEKYQCNGLCIIGLSINTMINCLKPISTCDTLKWEVFEDSCDVLRLSITNQEKQRVHEYDVKLIDIDCEMLDIPDKDFACVITLPSSDMQHTIRDLNHIGDKIHIQSADNDLVLSASGDSASLKISLKQSVQEMTLDKPDQDASAVINNKYASRYLLFFTKSSGLSQWTEIYLSQGYPMIIKYNVASIGYLQFCLAPCMEE